ncbi:cytochrome P450 87A3-like protein isoform X2 [Tanacetum coccineum]
MWPVSLCIAATAVVVSITHWLYRWWNPKCNGNLPPGSMGWPLLGETIQFFAPNTTWDTPPFVKERMKRYGSIFRTNLVGRPVIVSTDSDLNNMIFQQEGQLFQSWYPDSFTEVFGRQNVGSLHGYMYKYLKNMVLSLFGPESLKKMLNEVETVATRNLDIWAGNESVELKDVTANMIFDLTAKKLISYDPEKSSENLRENFVAFIQGLISFPLDIPQGTALTKCNSDGDDDMHLKHAREERRANPRESAKLIFLTMSYTLQETRERGIAEVRRVSGFKTDKDFVTIMMLFLYVCNYTIPAGWAVMVCPPAVHLNPNNYKDPLEFNPSRWERMEQKGASKNFMAFGGGMRFCVGTDFTKVQMAVFLHCLVTKYRWQIVRGGEIVRTPGLQFPNGLHVHFTEKDKQNQDPTSESDKHLDMSRSTEHVKLDAIQAPRC